MKYKTVFFGFGPLAYETLIEISKKLKIELIFTHHDIFQNDVIEFAMKNNIEYSTVDLRKNQAFHEKIKNTRPYFIISVNYRFIIPQKVFKLSEFAFNIHGSLLPKYRGRAPYVWAIINGEKESGVTAHLIETVVDSGKIIYQEKIKISPDMTGHQLLLKMKSLYPSIVLKSIDALLKEEHLTSQNENDANYFGKRTPDMGLIDFNKKFYEINNFVRALAEPLTRAYSYLSNGNKIFINSICSTKDFPTNNYPIGRIFIHDGNYLVKCKDAYLKILDFTII
jgi:methionyl-tRNA formyltransferase